MGKRTALYPLHVEAGARMVDFAGWDMPLHYGSQIDEHRQVREDAGIFDVSHMSVVDLRGSRTREFLRHLLANDVARLDSPGQALYSCMLNERGGVIDDLIAYLLSDDEFRLVINSATTDGDVAWIRDHAKDFEVTVQLRRDLAMLAVQGPQARQRVLDLLDGDARAGADALKPFTAYPGEEVFVSRTGYTGEDGFELVMDSAVAPQWWKLLTQAGARPCGLGARDTLRLEAGLNLYGQDMDQNTSPLASGLGWTIAWKPPERDFIGRDALRRQREQGDLPVFAGLVLEGRGVLRNHQKVRIGDREGEITSGSFSPTLGKAIALARLPAGAEPGTECEVEMRGKYATARIVRPPFVRNGKIRVAV